MERRGQALYSKVAEMTESEGVKKIFRTMAEEEKLHENYLSEQMKHYKASGTFMSDVPGNEIADAVFDKRIRDEIGSAGFEAAAISAAIDMEKRSVEIYSQRAQESEDVDERKCYNWLAKFEKKHLSMLSEMDHDLLEKVWYDNSFWPF